MIFALKFAPEIRQMALRGICVLSALSLVHGVYAQTTTTVPPAPGAVATGMGTTFDTRYTSTDSRIVVFDDSKQTFLALPTQSKELPQPVVMAIGPAGQELLQPLQMAPYMQLPGVYNRIRLVWGNGRDVQIVYNGPSTGARNGQAAAFGAVTPVSVHGATTKPISAPSVPGVLSATISQGTAPGTQLPGQAGQTPNIQTQVAAPTLSPPQESTPTIHTPPEKMIVEQIWEIKATDPNLASAFERWSTAAGMRLLWDAQQHVTLSTSDKFTGTFDEAITRVLSSPAIAKSKYPLEACIYANTPPVLRITKLGEQECAK